MIDPKMYSGGSSLFPSASYIRYLLLFFYCFSFLLSELLLMLLPLCFMFFLFFTIKSPTCFFICFFFKKNLCKRKKQSTYSFCFYSSLHSPSTISLPNRDSNGRLKFTVHWAESYSDGKSSGLHSH